MGKKQLMGRGVDVPAARVEGLIFALTERQSSRLGGLSIGEQRRCLTIIDRHLVRERNKGQACHWSYDFNRHLALKAARDVIMRSLEEAGAKPSS